MTICVLQYTWKKYPYRKQHWRFRWEGEVNCSTETTYLSYYVNINHRTSGQSFRPGCGLISEHNDDYWFYTTSVVRDVCPTIRVSCSYLVCAYGYAVQAGLGRLEPSCSWPCPSTLHYLSSPSLGGRVEWNRLILSTSIITVGPVLQ